MRATIIYGADVPGIGMSIVRNAISRGSYVFGIQGLENPEPIIDDENYNCLSIELDDTETMIHAMKSICDDASVKVEEIVYVETGKPMADNALKAIFKSYCDSYLEGAAFMDSSHPIARAHGDPVGLTGPNGPSGKE